jgi:hypothetical protein
MSAKKKIVAGFLVFSLSGFSPVLRLAQAEDAYAPPGPAAMPREAARAVVGRVFGVGGDAGDIKYHEFELTTHSPGNAAVRSLLIPGWGQQFNRQPTKGTLFFLTAVGAGAASVIAFKKSRDSYDTYKAKGVKDDSSYTDYVSQRNQAGVLGGLAIGLWIVSIVDAYRNAYTPLYGEGPPREIQVVLEDDGACLVYQKSF